MKSDKVFKLKLSLFIGLLIVCTFAKAQISVTKYYDANWAVTVKEKAAYYAEFIKEGNYYTCNSYLIGPKTLRGKSTYPDTLMEKPIGLQTLYYKNGHIEDSVFHNENGDVQEFYHFHENKQLAARYYRSKKNETVTEGFDENGKKLKNYVYAREAEFKSGDKGWHSYVVKNVSKDFTTANNNEQTTVSVHVEFVIDIDGSVINPKVIKSSGLKYVDADALNVISSSPQWDCAMQYNKPVRAFRMQPFSYLLSPLKK